MDWRFGTLVFGMGGLLSACSPSAGYGNESTAVATQHPASHQDRGVPSVDIDTFVRRTYFEGVPYEEAARYDESTVPALRAMLEDPSYAPYRDTIVSTIGVIGGREAAGTLTTFLTSLQGRPLDVDTFQAGLTTVTSLGYIRNGGQDVAASYLTYLVRRSGVDESSPEPALILDSVTLGPIAAQALAVSAHPSAEALFKEIEQQPAWAAKLNIEEALQTLHDVQANGLASHLGSSPS